jgi:hypothetical protein
LNGKIGKRFAQGAVFGSKPANQEVEQEFYLPLVHCNALQTKPQPALFESIYSA